MPGLEVAKIMIHGNRNQLLYQVILGDVSQSVKTPDLLTCQDMYGNLSFLSSTPLHVT